MSNAQQPFPSQYNLFRGISAIFIKEGKLSSAAFSNYEMSVDRGDMCSATQTQARKSAWIKVASFSHTVPQALNQEIKHDPKPDNNAHTLVIGKKTNSIRRKFAKESTLI